jgi:DNA helicase HerA-like ATPase
VSKTDGFSEAIAEGYGFTGPSLVLGAPTLDGKPAAPSLVRLPLAMVNRHGLVAGATGTGKTKTLQLLADQLSAAGVPVFCADMKGDLTGLARAGTSNDKIQARVQAIGQPWQPAANPVEFLSLTGTTGHQLRATVSSFGPLLLSRVLDLNDTQQSVLAMVFKLCDDKGLLLLDLPDLKQVLSYLTGAGAGDLADYGGLSKATAGVLLRKVVELEQQGADKFFGEPEFDVHDLLRVDANNRGIVSVLELTDVQEKPALFSTFMMWLLASLYRELPELGDVDKPRLVFFFDEAHLLFDGANKAFLQEIEQVVRLVRSKGVGVYFVTQTPKDVPADVLAQLGNRIQHALRAFTPDDEKALQATARTFPKSSFYDIPKTLTSLGIGEALVTVLSPRGTPTPVVATLLAPPSSLMGAIPSADVVSSVRSSALYAKYANAIDRESAREVLQRKAEGRRGGEAEGGGQTSAPEPNMMQTAGKILNSPMARTVGRELVRGLFGVLGLTAAARRRR